MRLRIVLLAVAGVAALAVAGLGVAVATLDFGRFAGPLAAQVERATGRALVFGGEVSLRVLPQPSLVLRDVTLANAPWGSRPEMLRIGRLEAALELRPLLFERRLHVTRLVARDADLLLERDGQGRGNWELGPRPDPAAAADGASAGPTEGVRTDVVGTDAAGADVVGGGAGGLPEIERMELANIALGWREGDELRSVLLRELLMSAREDGRLGVRGAVVHREQTLGFEGDLDMPTGFQAPGGPFVANARVTLPGAVVKLAGGLADARAGRGLDVTVAAEAEPVSALDELLGAALPRLRFELAARVQGDLGGTLRASELKLRLGRSALGGEVALDLSGQRPRVTGELEAARLDLAEAWPAGQAGPGAGSEAGAAEVPGAAPGAAPGAGDGGGAERRLFGAEPFDLSALGLADADLGLRVGVLAAPAVEVRDVVVRLVLADRDLALRPYGFELAGSHVAGDARLDAKADPPAMVLDLALQQAELGRLLALAGVDVPVAAKGDLVLALRGAGASPRALAGSLEGRASLVVGQGTIRGDYLDAMGLAVLRQAVPQLQRLEEARLNCAIARFDLARGVATARLLAADAGDIALVGHGTVNLGTEALALDLAPRLKVAIGGVRGGVAVPVQVRGTLLAPSVSVLGRGVRGNPLAALGRIVLDPGASQANPCGGLGEARPVAPAPRLPDVLRLLPR